MNINELLFYYHPDYLHISFEDARDEKIEIIIQKYRSASNVISICFNHYYFNRIIFTFL